jgi:hypothetical protein
VWNSLGAADGVNLFPITVWANGSCMRIHDRPQWYFEMQLSVEDVHRGIPHVDRGSGTPLLCLIPTGGAW